MSKKNYVNNKELEEWWFGWLITEDEYSWNKISDSIYKICQGVATKFNPQSQADFDDHVHDAFAQTLDKIKRKKLKPIRGKAPVFNLLTTTIIRILCSKMNRINKQKDHFRKYAYNHVVLNHREHVEVVECPKELSGCSDH